MKRIVECVPNVSEGRREEVVRRIARAAHRVPGAHLLGVEMDEDHNRSVLTLVGKPESIVVAVLLLVEAAIEEIDLTGHEGAHPRIGAVDVVPFVPLRGSTMEECIELAGETGRRIAERHELPVFFYGRAAIRPERSRLADLRRGGLDGLAERIASGDEIWQPDAGPAGLHPQAGAVAVGARRLLVAYNVELDTDDVQIARRIASKVREAGGGPPGVRALGLSTPSRKNVQVSMNLVDLDQTGVFTAFQAVLEQAREHDVAVRGGELVGFLPRAAVEEAFRAGFAPRGFGPERVLENRLDELLRSPHQATVDYLEALASDDPTPGGGSAAGLTAAQAAALGEKAARISAPRFDEERRTLLEGSCEALSARREAAHTLAWRDSLAYRLYLAARRTGDAEETARATEQAARVPLELLETIEATLTELHSLATAAHTMIVSDVRCAVALARGAAEGAEAMVRVNLASLSDAERSSSIAEELDALMETIRATHEKAVARLDERAGR